MNNIYYKKYKKYKNKYFKLKQLIGGDPSKNIISMSFYFKIPEKKQNTLLQKGQYVNYHAPEQEIRPAIIDKNNYNGTYNLKWGDPKYYKISSININQESYITRLKKSHNWIVPISPQEEYERKKIHQGTDTKTHIDFLDLEESKRENIYKENLKKYHDNHIIRKLVNIFNNENELNITVKLYTFVIPNDLIRDNLKFTEVLDNYKRINSEFNDFVRNNILETFKNWNMGHVQETSLSKSSKLISPYNSFKLNKDLYEKIKSNKFEVINLDEIIEEKETDFFYNCKAQGSIIDMMKFKSSVSENKNKSLIIDTNTEIPNYKKLFNETFKLEIDGYSIAYYKDHLNVNNKIYFNMPNSKFVEFFNIMIVDFFKSLINESERMRVYNPKNNVIFDEIFREIIYKLDISIKYQYGTKISVPVIQYDINYNKDKIQQLLRLTKFYVPAINMSWASKTTVKIVSEPILADDSIMNIQGFLGTIKKYLIPGIESNTCSERTDSPCHQPSIQGVNKINKWKNKRNFFINLSDRDFDNKYVYKFLEINYQNLKDYCRRTVANILIEKVDPKYISLLNKKGLPGFSKKETTTALKSISEPPKYLFMTEDYIKKERSERDLKLKLLDQELGSEKIISNENVIESLLELYNRENEASYFEKGKYEMCDLIARLDFIKSTIF